MLTTILVAAITALIMCFVVSLIEDFVLPRRSNAGHSGSQSPASHRQED